MPDRKTPSGLDEARIDQSRISRRLLALGTKIPAPGDRPGITLLMGWRRPEDWLDRLGLVVGTVWIAAGFLQWMTFHLAAL